LPRWLLSWSAFLLLAFANLWITADALRNGSTWYREYGLGGLQYGGQQVFDAVQQYLRENPDDQVIVSPAWMNGADVVARFFLGDPLPVRLGNIDDYLHHQLALGPEQVFVMTAEEYQRSVASGKFSEIQVLNMLPYPDGRPGFYFVRLRYVNNIAEVMVREQELRRQLQEGQALWAGQQLEANHSLLDMGSIQDILDGNPRSVTRTFEANPYLLEFRFPEPVTLSGLDLIIGDTTVRVQAQLFSMPGSNAQVRQAELRGTTGNPKVTFDFGEALLVQVLYLTVTDLSQGEPGHVHIWEIEFR
jgi:hypothetical protein